MRAWGYTGVTTVLLIQLFGCSGWRDEPLPQIRSATPLFAPHQLKWPFGAERDPLAVVEVEFTPCLKIAWRLGCSGALEFQVGVNEWGVTSATNYEGESSAALRACVQTAVSEVVFLPALDSRGKPVPAVLRGNLYWGPWQTGHTFGGVSGVIPWAREGCAGGPTKG